MKIELSLLIIVIFSFANFGVAEDVKVAGTALRISSGLEHGAGR
jgi:hypothetical protein